MDYLESILLGIVQGLTEFLPISSSGHIEIFKVFIGSELSNTESLLFTIILHSATALSTIYYFRLEVSEIFTGLINNDTNKIKFSTYILISMVPAVLIGLLFEEKIDDFFNGNLILIGIMLIITGLFLLITDFIGSKEIELNKKNSFLIGVAQAIAILPGISRSGATIACAVMLGIKKEKAAKFSFLMVVPIIFGSMIKSLMDKKISFDNFDFLVVVLGFCSAFITGLFACKWMIYLVKKSKLYYFSIYCFTIGGLLIIYQYKNGLY